MHRPTVSLLLVALVAVACMLGVTSRAAAASEAMVSLAGAAAGARTPGAASVRVSLENPTAAPLRVLSWETPVDGVSVPLFDVTRDGVPVAYTGMVAKRAAPTPKDYITLSPGERRDYVVDLAETYAFNATGTYVVRYAADSPELYLARGAKARKGTLASNALTITTLGSPAKTDVAPVFHATSVGYIGCSGGQQASLSTATADALTYATNASAYFDANRAGTRYGLWFGAFNSARWSTVKSHYASIATALGTAAVQYNCSTCVAEPDYASIYAYVYPSAPYTVYLCGAFWSASSTGTDSKAGTLVHEFSHFTVLGGTNDYVYGKSGAQVLAASSPASAIMNADNHEYFAENTPATTDNAAAFALTAIAHTFPSQPTGTTSSDYTFTLTSTGDINVALGTLTPTGDFVLTGDTCSGMTIAPAGSCAFTVAFAPSSDGTKAGAISLPSNALAAPASVALTGLGGGAYYSLSAAAYGFGNQAVGSRSAPYIVTLTSTGDEAVALGTLVPRGDFALSTDTCSGATLPTTGTCSFAVAFAPTSGGAKTGTITLLSNVLPGDGPTSFALTGTGIETAAQASATTSSEALTTTTAPRATPTALRASAIGDGSRLRVTLTASSTARTLRIQQRRRNGTWAPRGRTYALKPGTTSLTLDLPRGTYRVALYAQAGHTPALTAPVTLRR